MNNTEIIEKVETLSSGYANGYVFTPDKIRRFARWAAEQARERIIKFLQEMQRSVGDAHNHYGVAAVRIKEGV